MQITIPYKFKPRPYQLELLKALDSGINRAVITYHRRAGKDKTCFNAAIKKAVERRGIYYYFFPEFAQGRRVIWEGMDASGFPFLDHIPNELIRGQPNSTDMKITLETGSIIQIIGTDKFDKVRGANPVGCVFSEFAYQNPTAWDVVRPILRENGGWALFNSTPFGKNHHYKLTEMAKKNPNWFYQNIDVNHSLDENGNRYITDEMIQEEIDSGMPDEMVQQEFYNSFTANAQGFYYLQYIEDARKEGRICNLPHDPSVPVDTWWDIGTGESGDNTAIWFTQFIGREIHIIDFYQYNTRGLDHYVEELQKRKYTYGTHWFPHDMAKTEFGSGRTIFETAENLLGTTAKLDIVQKLSKQDGINAVRMLLPRVYFNNASKGIITGLDCLSNYHRQWDDKQKVFKREPVHDWTADAADAFRYLAVGLTMPKKKNYKAAYIQKMSRNRVSSRGWMAS